MRRCRRAKEREPHIESKHRKRNECSCLADTPMPEAVYGDRFYDCAPYVLILLMLVCRTVVPIARCLRLAPLGLYQMMWTSVSSGRYDYPLRVDACGLIMIIFAVLCPLLPSGTERISTVVPSVRSAVVAFCPSFRIVVSVVSA